MVIGNADTVAVAADTGANNSTAHPSGIPQDKIDNIMSGIANTGDVKMNNHRKKLRQRFDIIKKLGQGTYGKVQLGINKETGQEVAIKTIKKCKIEAEADLVRIRREVQIMSSVQHPNIIHIYEVFENREKMVLVMEFAAGGELYDYLSERKVLSESEARRIFRQVATAVYYCHKHKICHRDLKLENILLDEQGNAKIADFGLSNVFDDQRLLATFCGSPLYASPEIVEGTPYHGPEVDCWSLGVLLYTLVYGSMPFDGSNFKRLVKQISEGDYFEPKKPSRASTLIRDMLTVSPRKRATIEQICSHWWVNENDNMSCLDLAEDLANQTPVRLDVLLSLTPAAITADQLVVPSADGSVGNKTNERVARSHSVGSIRDMGGNTEAERRILDMVAAGGEAALMPSPTRTITPAHSPIQPKRKLEPTLSTDNASGAVKKEKAGSRSVLVEKQPETLNEETPMDISTAEESAQATNEQIVPTLRESFSQKDMEMVGNICSKLIQEENTAKIPKQAEIIAEEANSAVNENSIMQPQRSLVGKLDSVAEAPEEKEATKVIKKFVNKHKTNAADAANAMGQTTSENKTTEQSSNGAKGPTGPPPFVRKCSLQDESTLSKFNSERRKSRILETAEKFNQMNANMPADKSKKSVSTGVNVGSFKKEFERKASTPTIQGPTPGERRAMEEVAAAVAAAKELEAESTPSISSFVSLEDDNENKTVNEIDQLCAKTENIDVGEPLDPYAIITDRELKLQNARTIIGNAIQPVIRRPTSSAPTTPAQPQPPQAPSSVFGNGASSGGRGQLLRSGMAGIHGTVSSGAAVSSMPINLNYNNNNNNNNNNHNRNVDDRIVPPWLKWSNVKQQQQGNTNIAVAAARQNIISRLATAPHIPMNINEQSSSPKNSSLNDYNNAFMPQTTYNSQISQQQRAKYQHQQQQQQQTPMNRVKQLQRHISVPPLASNVNCYTAATAATLPNFATANNANKNSVPKPFYNAPPPTSLSSSSTFLKYTPGAEPNPVKTSSASITLKSATLPRRKTAKTEIQLEIKPRPVETPSMRFTTEMQHPVADLRSAPAREGPMPFTAIHNTARAASLEPKEHIIPIQRPPTYTRTTSNTTTRSSGSLSRQSTGDSESDTNTTTANLSQSTITGSSQPIKKSPREFIIPIAVEGGGFITPREGSIEPSESSHTTTSSRSTFNRLRPTRRIGSLLNNSGVEEESPFPKMRTSSINRDSEDDPRFSLHRLRSTRPMKKVSQENDSASSGEEDDDDDDGFEILTAENLFSTLLQRVRALTNRLNVNNDMSSGFPNTSNRLFNNMRSGQSSFWNQDPFRRTQVSYTFSETIEKKQVRLNNMNSNMGAPWRHSMAGRDLGSDMDSIFSRTGATLPRGSKTALRQKSKEEEANFISNNCAVNASEEPLDLADLDLSRLRLSKKDLETLSSIAPGLPKCFQEQLLAKLPPTQARKLSRTLSMQNEPSPSVPVYKRSQSSGRSMSNAKSTTEDQSTTTTGGGASSSRTSDESGGERSFVRRSVSRTRPDYETAIPGPLDVSATKSRSGSVCRDDCNKSLCAPYSSDISDKYKYYSPYLMKPISKEVPSVSPSDGNSTSKRLSDTNVAASLARPPSGYNNATNTDVANNGSLRRRASQRRISRFLRPDFFEEPIEENAYLREKKSRERETQHVLRQIREKSCEPSRDRLNNLDADIEKNVHPDTNQLCNADTSQATARHVRNKSLELYSAAQTNGTLAAEDNSKRQIRSLSRPREIAADIDKNELADKILQELQLLSAVRNKQEQLAVCPAECVKANLSNGFELPVEKTATIKKVKKVKAKDKLSDDANKIANNALVGTVKKVKKVVKKTEDLNGAAVAIEETEANKKESKLKRPKSYPMKEFVTATVANNMPTKVPSKLSSNMPECESCEQMSSGLPIPLAMSNAITRESRLVRPKSYPATKLIPPQAIKKIARSDMEAINSQATTPKSSSVSRQSTSEENYLSLTPTGKGSGGDNSSSSDSRTQSVKKVIKVTKKSKLIPPTALTPSTDELKERASPEKKPKGLLYVIGQKFEKLRDSAMNKDRKTNGNSVISASSSSATCLTANKSSSSSENSSPEKIKQKTNILRKKKSLTDAATPKTEKAVATADANNTNSSSNKPKTDKRSRIDAVWRTLRERSVPRVAAPNNDTSLLKRAISVEEMRGNSNRTAVNKVLGLFKRFDKDSAERRVRSAQSTSNIERKMYESPESPIYQNTSAIEALAKSQRKSKSKENYCGDSSCSCGDSKPTTPSSNGTNQKLQNITCPDCIQDEVSKNRAEEITKVAAQFKEPTMTGNKDKRKGLMLELNKIDNSKYTMKNNYTQYNGLYSNLPPYPEVIKSSSNNSSSQHSMDNTTTTRTTNNISSLSNNNNNNNSLLQNSSHTSGYHSSSTHEINRNHLLTPSCENIANYSSDSRSYQDDCVSNSTFLSPTDEPELCFDNWSVCSEDNYMRHMTPSPTVSRLSRASQRSSPTRAGDNSDPNESVIDRIKRRSFYCRFNDKKPRRTSTIVGPNATRDYYREQQSAIKARSNNKINMDRSERNVSPDITHEFFRPLKLSPVGTELKPPIYRSPLEYAISSGSATNRPRKSLNDIRPLITPNNSSSSTTPSYNSRRYTTNCERDNDYLSSMTSGTRYRTPATNANMYDAAGMMSSNSSYYNTYNPKRRSSYTLNGTLPNGSAHIDGYATVGRRAVRPYDQRTLSLHDARTPTSSNSSTYRRDARTPVRDYSSGISRSNSRYRNTPTPRSPTNI